MRRDVRSILCALVLATGVASAQTRDPRTWINELKRLSVDQLVDVEVTSVSRAAQRLGGAAAAVTVVTDEDIRRSGATTVPDALRMVPGIYVGRRTSNRWAVSARGFRSINSEKLLVLSDTRSIYNATRPAGRHPEFGPPDQRGEIARDVYAKVAWGFWAGIRQCAGPCGRPSGLPSCGSRSPCRSRRSERPSMNAM